MSPTQSTTTATAGASDPLAMSREVPPGETPVRCPHCEEPFPDETTLTLHEGLEHYEALSGERQREFAEVYEQEDSDLRSFQLRALVGLTLLYFGFLFAYAMFA